MLGTGLAASRNLPFWVGYIHGSRGRASPLLVIRLATPVAARGLKEVKSRVLAGWLTAALGNSSALEGTTRVALANSRIWAGNLLMVAGSTKALAGKGQPRWKRAFLAQ